MMRSPLNAQVSKKALSDYGFQRWWNPVHKLLGCLEFVANKIVQIAQNLPWDGACGGRFDTIMRFADHKHRKLVWDFLSSVKALPPPDW